MGLNLSKGDMYKFVNYTWNPIKGKCLHDCSYCYMKKIKPNANPPRLAEYVLNTDLGCGRSIFIGSSTDMFAEDIPSEWIARVLNYCYQNRNMLLPNAYLLQSKNPKRFLEFINHPIMERVVFCTTIETNRFYPEIMNKAPRIEERVEAMEEIARRMEESLDQQLQQKVGRIEPTIVILTSILVGVILMAVMLPLIHIMSSIG